MGILSFEATEPVKYNHTRPNQRHGEGDPLADITEQFTGRVEGTIKRESLMAGFIPTRSVRNTSTITSRGISRASVQAIQAGVTPQASSTPNTSKIALRIDTVIIARNSEPMLDEFQTDYDYQGEVAAEQGKAISNMYDETMFIMAAKAALATDSPYGTSEQMEGHSGGNVVTLGAANDYKDPAKMYDAIAQLVTKFYEKDVRPEQEDMILVVKPEAFTALLQSDYVVNGNYVTSQGTTLNTKWQFSTWGVPVVHTNNAVMGKHIKEHLLSNEYNDNAYNGDFTDVIAQMFSPRALMAGETIPVTSEVFFDKLSKMWFIDSWLSFGVTVNRPEYAGVIKIPV